MNECGLVFFQPCDLLCNLWLCWYRFSLCCLYFSSQGFQARKNKTYGFYTAVCLCGKSGPWADTESAIPSCLLTLPACWWRSLTCCQIKPPPPPPPLWSSVGRCIWSHVYLPGGRNWSFGTPVSGWAQPIQVLDGWFETSRGHALSPGTRWNSQENLWT